MELNIYCENEFDNWKLNEEEIIEVTKKSLILIWKNPKLQNIVQLQKEISKQLHLIFCFAIVKNTCNK